jgi:hypothetical protein
MSTPRRASASRRSTRHAAGSLAQPAVGAYAANDYAPATIARARRDYDVPTTARRRRSRCPPRARRHARVLRADGTKNGHTVQYRDATGPTNLTTALTASKRHLVIVEKLGGKWFANAYVSP